MTGNWEVVIGTVSGFLVAIFADLTKGWLQRRVEHNRLRDMLYQEILNNHGIAQSIFPELSLPDLNSTITYRLSMEGYEYAKTNNIALFYELREASCFNQLYSIIRQLKNTDKKTSQEKIEKLFNELFSLFVSFIETGALDEKRLDKLSKKTETKTVYKWVGKQQ